jgi:hypothetical protein
LFSGILGGSVLFDKLAGGTKDDKILRIIPGIPIQNKKCEILVYRRYHAVRQKKIRQKAYSELESTEIRIPPAA